MVIFRGSTDLPLPEVLCSPKLRPFSKLETQSCSKGRLDMDHATKTTLKQKQLMAIWCFKCTNDSRRSFTLRTWLVQSAFSSSFQRASACSGGKNQFRLGQTWMKTRQRTMQNSWFLYVLSMSSGHLIAVVFLDFLPSQPECQVGPRNEPASNMSNLSQVSLNILQSVGVCLQPIKSRCLQTKQPKFKQTNHCRTSRHLSRYLWYLWYLWYLYLSHLHHLGSWRCLLFEIWRNYAHDPHGSPHSRGPRRIVASYEWCSNWTLFWGSWGVIFSDSKIFVDL